MKGTYINVINGTINAFKQKTKQTGGYTKRNTIRSIKKYLPVAYMVLAHPPPQYCV